MTESTAKPLPKVLYTAVATAIGGRDGTAKTNDGKLDVRVTPPGGNGDGTNPEQLFATGYAACFGSAVAHVARAQKLTTGTISITANVMLGPVEGGFGLQVELVGEIPDLPRDQAEALLRRAHEVCPYSNATRNNIVVDVRLA